MLNHLNLLEMIMFLILIVTYFIIIIMSIYYIIIEYVNEYKN